MGRKFVRGMAVYALVVLLLGAAGLGVLWRFLQAYEASRSQYAVAAYVDSLTAETVLEHTREELAHIDPNIQSAGAAQAAVCEACADGFQAVKDSAASTETVLSYKIRCGKQQLGCFTLQVADKGPFGLPVWKVTKSEFDLSPLYGPPVQLIVDSRAQVLLEGKALSEEYITERDIPYALFAEMADDYAFPTRVSYTLDGYLGTLSPRILDQNGQDVTGEDYENVFLKDNCGDEAEALKTTLETFVKRYIAFSGSTGSSARGNLSALRRLIVSGSPLYTRLASALDGLTYGQSIRDQLAEIQYNHLLRLDEENYFCDVTYLVDTTGKKGVVQTTSHLKLLLTLEEGRLKVWELSSY